VSSVLDELTVGGLLARAVRRNPDGHAIVVDDRHLDFGALDEQSAQLARQLLAAGISKGSRVGLLFPNDERFVIAWFATTRIGAVAVPLSTLATAPELVRTVRHADLQLVLCADRFRSHDYVARWEQALPGIAAGRPYRLLDVPFLRDIWIWGDAAPTWAGQVVLDGEPDASVELLEAAQREVYPSDPASIIYTSGSTADPKGVVHAHASIARQARNGAELRSLTPTDRVFTAMPFFWVGGLTVALLACVHAGAALLVCSSAEPDEVLDFLERERLTFYLGWAHLAKALEQASTFPDRDFSPVRGGTFYAALPPELRPTDLTLINEGLGMTETAGPHSQASMVQVPESLRGTFGPAVLGMDHRIVDARTGQVQPDGVTGELQVRGDTLMLGLHKRERHTYLDRDGWYPTGDLAHLRDGQLYFHGRLDDMVKTNGANVSPREVERVLLEIDGVSSAFVTGVTDTEGVTRVGAVVITAPGAEVTPSDIVEGARSVLSSFKVPRHVVVIPVDLQPITSSGKADRKALVALLEKAAVGDSDAETP
jgi:acyl-CoA synthetase (AMP-forming)/AMP-acid ligase II